MNDVVTWSLVGESFITLFVIMDPPGTVPIFLGLMGGRSLSEVKRSALQATLVSLFVIVLFALFGQAILSYLNISIAALQCSGGLLLLLVALELLTGKQDAGADHSGTAGNVAMVPLGTPLLAGPGAIVATMVFTKRVDGFADGVGIALGIVAVHIAIWMVMRYSTFLLKLLRESGVMLVTRIMGLLLAAIAVQMIATGVRAFIQQ